MNENSILDAVLCGLWRVLKGVCIGFAVVLMICCALAKKQ